MSDVSEYTFANTYFEGWRHWEQICKTWWFKPIIDNWREELAVKIQAESVARILKISESGGKDALTANKYVAERGWEKTPRNRVGRPNKTPDVLDEARRILSEEQQLEEDAQRIAGPVN